MAKPPPADDGRNGEGVGTPDLAQVADARVDEEATTCSSPPSTRVTRSPSITRTTWRRWRRRRHGRRLALHGRVQQHRLARRRRALRQLGRRQIAYRLASRRQALARGQPPRGRVVPREQVRRLAKAADLTDANAAGEKYAGSPGRSRHCWQRRRRVPMAPSAATASSRSSRRRSPTSRAPSSKEITSVALVGITSRASRPTTARASSEPEGILGPIATIPNAGKINALSR